MTAQIEKRSQVRSWFPVTDSCCAHVCHPCGAFFFVSVGSSRAFVANTWVGLTCVCNSLHASFAVCGSLVKQGSHYWHFVLDTVVLYTFLNFITQFILILNLYLETELIIVNIDLDYIHSVYRSLEIHNCALTSSPLPPLLQKKKRPSQKTRNSNRAMCFLQCHQWKA